MDFNNEDRAVKPSLSDYENLLAKRESLFNNRDSASDVRKNIQKDINELNKQIKDLENKFTSLGIPFNKRDNAAIYNELNNELNELNSKTELITWLASKFPESYKTRIKETHQDNFYPESKILGKWIGRFMSNGDDSYPYPAEFSFGICQFGNKVFGYGALLDSLYNNAFLRGLVDEDEIFLEIYSDSRSLKSLFMGEVEEDSGKILIRGDYYVEDGLDKGKVDSTIENGKIPLSEKGKILTLISEMRQKMKGAYNSSIMLDVLKVLADIESIPQNEIILLSGRVETLRSDDIKGVLPYGKISIERNKIGNAILELMEYIEDLYKKT